jgi:hypothetical protein
MLVNNWRALCDVRQRLTVLLQMDVQTILVGMLKGEKTLNFTFQEFVDTNFQVRNLCCVECKLKYRIYSWAR